MGTGHSTALAQQVYIHRRKDESSVAVELIEGVDDELRTAAVLEGWPELARPAVCCVLRSRRVPPPV